VTGALPPVWNPASDEDLVCVAVRRETHDVATFVFAAAEPRLFHFLPGQFMTLELAAAGVQRCYTIASPPTRPHRIEVTAKRTPAGIGSGWLHDAMRPGVRVSASLPRGAFTFTPQQAGRVLFLSAGSGITPLMSMARTAHDLGSDTDILFVHSARSPADLVFADELSAMTRRPGFARVSIVEEVPAGTAWDGLRGRLSPAMLQAAAPDLLTRDVFCCGPAPYMAAVRAMLDTAGFDRARYHEESFAFAALDVPAPEPTPVSPSGAGQIFTVAFARAGRTVACPPGSTILAAARAAGLRLPFACSKGVCGTCKSRLISGIVELHHGGGIRQREIDAGMTLLCCARPTSDLVVDR
jgi:ferredoxin-NADP reductase